MDDKTTEADGTCPPDAAVPAAGEVFRCCRSNPISANGMQTAEESGRFPNADSCLRRALSVFRDNKDAEHQVRLFRRWKQKLIAKATLSEEHGKTLPTGKPSHTSWWPAEGFTSADRASIFSVVVEIQS